MNSRLSRFLIAFTALSFAIVGCAPNAPYRTSFGDSPDPDPTKAVIETTNDYKLGFVEFDDQGVFWDQRQRQVVEKMATDESTGHGVVLVAFVHGWKDNASSDSDGVVALRQILAELGKAEQAQHDHPPRKVIGVYVGWRGLSAKWEPFKELSFWERKSTAHKVGGYGAMTELLVDLELIQKKSLDNLPPDQARTELIVIGHSFGGAAVYSALGQIITERFVNATAHHQRLRPLGDQVILLNPAFEALRHFDLDQMAKAIENYPRDQRPVLSIFTSQGDWATHYAFPVGRFFSTLFQFNRDDDQRKAGLQTVGWFHKFITHDLVYDANRAMTTTTTRPTTSKLAAQQHPLPTMEHMRASHENIKTQREKWSPGPHPPQTYDFDETTLKPRPDYHPGDPFLVVSVDPKIMSGHTDIANPVVINFIREYIQFCQVDSKDHSK